MEKAFDTRIPPPRIRHFERMREIFFVRGQAKDVRGAASGKHRTPSKSGSRCFMQTALRRKKEYGKRKRSLGYARDDDTRERFPHIPFHPAAEANLRPFGAPPSMGRRENAASPQPALYGEGDDTRDPFPHVSFHPDTEANLRPFGAPPSTGRRENHALVPSHQHPTKKSAARSGCTF